MKSITLSIFCLFFCFQAIAQNFQPYFLGEDFKLYKGCLFKIDKTTTSGLTHSIYDNVANLKGLYNNNVAYPDAKYNFKTIVDSLLNKTFRVDKFLDEAGNELTDELKYGQKPVLKLIDTLTQNVLFYKYDTRYSHSFPFLVSPIKYDKEKICHQLEKEVDEFTNKITIRTPMSDNYRINPIYISKVIGKTSSIYYLSLNTIGETLNVREKGAIILFTDGTRMTKNVDIDVEGAKDGYEYSAFISLNLADLNILSTKMIKKFRLYIYDEAIEAAFADKFKLYVECIRKAK